MKTTLPFHIIAGTIWLIGCAGAPSGTGISTHKVDLSWIASTSENVSGYNIYRAAYDAGSCKVFYKINSVLVAGTSYTDFEIVNGMSYCYATTAVNTRNEESAYSNIVSEVQIPDL